MTETKPSLTEFLLARLSEDEAVAKAATVGSESWRLGEYAETVLWWPPASPEQVAFIREKMGDEIADRDASWSGQTIEVAGDRIAPHIARHDPARVLADVEAKRRIVELHAPEGPACSECGGFTSTTTPRGIEHGGYLTPWPCPTLRALAQPYAAHPEFRGEWAL